MSERIKGIVKWFDEKRGYGFISQEDGKEDLFVHFSGIMNEKFRTLNEGAPVEFEIAVGTKGKQAVNVSNIL